MHRLLHSISCFNFDNKPMHFIKVIGNITNCVMLLIFHDIRLFKPYALNVLHFSALNWTIVRWTWLPIHRARSMYVCCCRWKTVVGDSRLAFYVIIILHEQRVYYTHRYIRGVLRACIRSSLRSPIIIPRSSCEIRRAFDSFEKTPLCE